VLWASSLKHMYQPLLRKWASGPPLGILPTKTHVEDLPLIFLKCISVNSGWQISQLSAVFQSTVSQISVTCWVSVILKIVNLLVESNGSLFKWFFCCFIAISYITLHTEITYFSTFLISSVYYRMGENVAMSDTTLWSKTDSAIFFKSNW